MIRLGDTTLLIGTATSVIPSYVTAIADYAFFERSDLTSITFPDDLAVIGSWAFYNCSSLTGISIPASVTEICEDAFEGCSALETIAVDEENAVYEGAGNCLVRTEDKLLLRGCNTSVIPNGVTGIFDYAFSDCALLTSITLPSTLSSIGSGAFSNCDGLTSIVIPRRITVLENTFFDCNNLQTVTFAERSMITIIGYGVFEDCNQLESIQIPYTVTTIGDWAFSDCTSLMEVSFVGGSRLMSIGNFAFGYCPSLLDVTFHGVITEVGNGAFYGWNFPQTVRMIVGQSEAETWEEGWDYGCDATFVWNAGWEEASAGLEYTYIEELNGYEVSAGTSLQSGEEEGGVEHVIFIPPTYGSYRVVRIAEEGFYGYENLTAVIFVETRASYITSIGARAFAGCENLRYVSLPSRVTTIEEDAFADCSLRGVIILRATITVEDGAFDSSNCITVYSTGSGDAETMPTLNDDFIGAVLYNCRLSREGGYIMSMVLSENNVYESSISAPYRLGYEFLGWTTVSGGTEVEHYSWELPELPVGTTLYTIWEACE